MYSDLEAQRLFKALVSHKESLINQQDAQGRTPLMIAAENNNAPAVRALLENDANVYLKDTTGQDVLVYANHNPALVAVLTKHKTTRKEGLSQGTGRVLPDDIENIILEK